MSGPRTDSLTQKYASQSGCISEDLLRVLHTLGSEDLAALIEESRGLPPTCGADAMRRAEGFSPRASQLVERSKIIDGLTADDISDILSQTCDVIVKVADANIRIYRSYPSFDSERSPAYDLINVWYSVIGHRLIRDVGRIQTCDEGCLGVFVKTNPNQRFCGNTCFGSWRRPYVLQKVREHRAR